MTFSFRYSRFPGRSLAGRARLRLRRAFKQRPLCWAEYGKVSCYGQPGYDVFIGYYDHSPANPGNGDILALMVPEGARPDRTPADLVVFPASGGSPHVIAQTYAWAWQLGSRQRWLDDNRICYCDRDGGRFVTRIVDADGRRLELVPDALFDIDRQGRFGVSLNFARLQTLRPGYGFARDAAVDLPLMPSDEGLTAYRLGEEKGRHILALDDAARLSGGNAGSGWHYFNHISINPSGTRILAFHVRKEFSGRRHVRAITVGPEGEQARVISEGDETPSHYYWLDDELLLLTTADQAGRFRFLIVNDKSGVRTSVPGLDVSEDGHPTLDPRGGGILFDCYPDRLAERHVFYHSLLANRTVKLASFYSPPQLGGEKKCDLHPRFSPDGNLIFVDSAHAGYRQVCVFAGPPGQ